MYFETVFMYLILMTLNMKYYIFIVYLDMSECLNNTIKFTISAFVKQKVAIIGQIWEIGHKKENNFDKTQGTWLSCMWFNSHEWFLYELISILAHVYFTSSLWVIIAKFFSYIMYERKQCMLLIPMHLFLWFIAYCTCKCIGLWSKLEVNIPLPFLPMCYVTFSYSFVFWLFIDGDVYVVNELCWFIIIHAEFHWEQDIICDWSISNSIFLKTSVTWSLFLNGINQRIYKPSTKIVYNLSSFASYILVFFFA